jgi:DNA-binding transcriptional MerR regulator
MNSEAEGTGRRPIANASAEVELHPQTLRKYERAGLLRPARREGGSRHYSDEDLARLVLIKHLAAERRMNVAGIRLALELHDEVAQLLEVMDRTGQPSAATLVREHMQRMLRLIECDPPSTPVHRDSS